MDHCMLYTFYVWESLAHQSIAEWSHALLSQAENVQKIYCEPSLCDCLSTYYEILLSHVQLLESGARKNLLQQSHQTCRINSFKSISESVTIPFKFLIICDTLKSLP